MFRRLTEVQFRQVLCNIYAKKIKKNAEFIQLQELLRGGTNLRLMGYTAHDMVGDTRSLEEIYLDPRSKIGHEFVLLCLLRGEAPWAAHTTLPNIFEDPSKVVAFVGSSEKKIKEEPPDDSVYVQAAIPMPVHECGVIAESAASKYSFDFSSVWNANGASM
jgi:hypothetical protein